MTEDGFDKTIDHNPEENPAPQQPRANWVRRLVIGGLALVAVAGAGAAIAGGGWGGHGGWRHGGHGFGMGGVERILDEVDATAEQEEKLWAIIDGARGEVRPIMRGFRDAHEQAVELLKAPTIDRAAVEKLRAERIAAIDQASQKMSAALVEAAEVFTPEQRAKLALRMEQHGRW
jgi:protein CpxP